jgi:mono/diheme cytochrome c family protein
MTKLFATLAAVLIASPLSAGHCVQPQRVVNHGYYYSPYRQVNVQQVYQPYYYQVGTDLRAEAQAELIARKVEAKLLKRGIIGGPAAVQEHPGKKLLTASCIGCHKPGTKAVTEKEAPVFFDEAGKLKELSDKQKEKIDAAVNEGRMPPTGEPLDDGEYVTIRDYLFPKGGEK